MKNIILAWWALSYKTCVLAWEQTFHLPTNRLIFTTSVLLPVVNAACIQKEMLGIYFMDSRNWKESYKTNIFPSKN